MFLMNKRWIFSGVLLVTIAVCAIILMPFLAQNTRVNFAEDTLGTVSIVSEDRKYNIRNIHTGSTIKLPDGKYTYSFSNNDYTKEGLAFTKTASLKSIELTEPSYSKSKLSNILEGDKSALTRVLLTTLTNAPIPYVIRNISLYDKGEWAGAVVTPSEYDENNPQGLYRILLRKSGTSWSIVGSPQFVLTKYNIPNAVPLDILTAINLLQ